LDQYHYDLSKNESGNYTSNDTQVLYYGYRQALRRITKLKAENKHLIEIFDEAMKSASEYAEKLCTANKENEMMREMISDWINFEDDSISRDGEYVGAKINLLIKRAREILKKINKN